MVNVLDNPVSLIMTKVHIVQLAVLDIVDNYPTKSTPGTALLWSCNFLDRSDGSQDM